MRTSAADRIARAIGWSAAAGVAAAESLRVMRAERHPVGIAVQSVSAWLTIPAGVVATLAVVRRRRALTAVSLPLCVGAAALTVKAMGRGRPAPAPAGSARLRLVSANVLESNSSMADGFTDLATDGADVILLQEITPQHLTDMKASGLFEAYPHHVLDPQVGYNGSAILSRLPMVERGRIQVGGHGMTSAIVPTPAGPLRIVNVHAVAPVSGKRIAVWRTQLSTLGGIAPPPGGYLVLAGDFNATLDHAGMASLLHRGLRDAFLEAGTGLGATWPRWRGPMPPVMRIDHVMVSGQVTVVGLHDEVTTGSDHRRLVTDLALSPSA